MAAVDYLLKLDAIEGESTDAKHNARSCSSRAAGASRRRQPLPALDVKLGKAL